MAKDPKLSAKWLLIRPFSESYCRAKSLNLTKINFAQIIPTDKKPEVIQDEITKLRFCCAACYKKAMDSYFTTFREGSTSSSFQKSEFTQKARVQSGSFFLSLVSRPPIRPKLVVNGYSSETLKTGFCVIRKWLKFYQEKTVHLDYFVTVGSIYFCFSAQIVFL